MTRNEAEAKILKKLEEIRKIVAEYNPEDLMLSAFMDSDYISFNNRYWEHKDKGVLNCSHWDEEGGEE